MNCFSVADFVACRCPKTWCPLVGCRSPACSDSNHPSAASCVNDRLPGSTVLDTVPTVDVCSIARTAPVVMAWEHTEHVHTAVTTALTSET